MKRILQTEEALQLAVAIIALYLLPVHFAWWLWILLFLSPDLSFIAYGVNPKAGGIAYNILHFKGTAILVFVTGLFLNHPYIQAAGILLWAHSSFDRVLGYGLKHLDAFKHTHLTSPEEFRVKQVL